MPRKTPLPSEHLVRLKDLYDRQREKLVALRAADDSVAAADEAFAAAQRRLKDAQTHAKSAYQALVDLVGAAAAAQLTGRRLNGKCAASTRKAPTTAQGNRPRRRSLSPTRPGPTHEQPTRLRRGALRRGLARREQGPEYD